jgi:hypothetical protein
VTQAKYKFSLIKICMRNGNENFAKIITPFENKPITH